MIRQGTILLIALLLTVLEGRKNLDYPNSVGQSGNFSVNDKVIATSYSKQTTDSFRDVVSWYAERMRQSALLKQIDDYHARDASSPDFRSGSLASTSTTHDGHDVSTAVYAFTPTHMHVTIIAVDEDGDTVTLSIAGSDKSTTINIVRRLADRTNQITK